MMKRSHQKRKLVQEKEEQTKKRHKKKGHGSQTNKSTGAPPMQEQQSTSHYQPQELTPFFPGQAAQLQTSQMQLRTRQATLQTSQVPLQTGQQGNVPGKVQKPPTAAQYEQMFTQFMQIVHAYNCEQAEENIWEACSFPQCHTMRNLLDHIGTCDAGKSCPVAHCVSATEIMTHLADCGQLDCPVCLPFIQSMLPPEILHLDERSQQLFREALAGGTERVYDIRLMVIGHQGVGKTSLVKRMLGEEVREGKNESTVGIEVHSLCCKIDHETGTWNRIEPDPQRSVNIRMLWVLDEHIKNRRYQLSSGAVYDREESSTQKKSSGRDKKLSISTKRNSRMGSKEDKKKITKNKRTENCTVKGNKDLRKFCEQYLIPTIKFSSNVTILDFAGQFLYYTVHQTFMSWRTIYLLVTDMSLDLTDLVKGESCGIDVNGKKQDSIQDYVTYWFNSIHSHAFLPVEHELDQCQEEKNKSLPKIDRKIPPVILVGTHRDKIQKRHVEKKTKTHFDNIRRVLKNRPLHDYLVDEFAVSNVEPDPTIDVLKSKIFELAKTQSYWGQVIPARWLFLRLKLLDIKEIEGKLVMDYTEVESLNESLEVKIESKEELDLFLKFEHELGNVIYFGTQELGTKVILDPQWLIQGLKIWITSDEVIKKHPDLHDDWYRFKDTGQLTQRLMDMLWSKHLDFDQHKQHLLDVMEKLNIIATPLVKESDEDGFCWVPCMVQTSAAEYWKIHPKREDVTKTPTLCFVSEIKFIHVGVFHRLLASFLSKWQPVKMGEKYLLFNGICEFELDECHNLILSLNDYIIQATVIRFSTKGDDPEISVCINIREYMFTTLKEIAACLCPSCSFEICIQCNKSPVQSNEGLHKITDLRKMKEMRCSSHKDGPLHCVESSQLLRFWEREDQRIPSSMQTAQLDLDRNNFMKLHSLLVDVGTKVLRNVVRYYTVTPNCSLDQYLKNHEKVLKTLQKRNKILHKYEIDILFPQQGPTDLSKYDITLSSLLLSNIVPALDQQYKQKINDLRQERNKLLHATSTMMSTKNFQIKWTKITTILTVLTKLCQDADLDKEIQTAIRQIEQPGQGDLETMFGKYKEDLKNMEYRIQKMEQIMDILKGDQTQ